MSVHGEDVTATLRERIANAIARVWTDGEVADVRQPENYGWDVDNFLAMADGVIADLGMTLVDCRICGMADGGPCEDGFDYDYQWTLHPMGATDG